MSSVIAMGLASADRQEESGGRGVRKRGGEGERGGRERLKAAHIIGRRVPCDVSHSYGAGFC